MSYKSYDKSFWLTGFLLSSRFFLRHSPSAYHAPIAYEMLLDMIFFFPFWTPFSERDKLSTKTMLLPNSEFCLAALNIGLTEPEFRL